MICIIGYQNIIFVYIIGGITIVPSFTSLFIRSINFILELGPVQVLFLGQPFPKKQHFRSR